MRRQILLTLSLFWGAGAARAQSIPLDRLHPESPSVLSRQGQGDTLFGWVGRKDPWRVRQASAPEALSVKMVLPGAPEEFLGFGRITETTPTGALEKPHLREFNLPDLIDRLVRDGALPAGSSRLQAASNETALLVTAPTLVAASFALDRTVTLINSGTRLVVICPLCVNLRVVNEKRLDAQEKEPVTEVWSYLCPKNLSGPGTFKIHRLWSAGWIGETCEKETRLQTGQTLTPTPWMPQVLLSQILRAETPFETLKRWQPMYTLAFSEVLPK